MRRCSSLVDGWRGHPRIDCSSRWAHPANREAGLITGQARTAADVSARARENRRMKRTHWVSLAAALVVGVSLVGVTHAQQQGGGSPFGAVTPQTKTRVVVIGENNTVRKLDK